MDQKRVLRRGVSYAGRDHKHVARDPAGIDVRPACGGQGRVVALLGEAAQEGVAQRVVAGRFRANPRCHVTVQVVNVVKVSLIHDDRGGELKQHVVMVAADVVHHVGIVVTVLPDIGYP